MNKERIKEAVGRIKAWIRLKEEAGAVFDEDGLKDLQTLFDLAEKVLAVSGKIPVKEVEICEDAWHIEDGGPLTRCPSCRCRDNIDNYNSESWNAALEKATIAFTSALLDREEIINILEEVAMKEASSEAMTCERMEFGIFGKFADAIIKAQKERMG